MTHQPPLPAASTSPYPLHPAPLDEPHEQPLGQKPEIVEADKAGGVREVSVKRLGIGAAVGIGSAAIAAALLYVRGKRDNGTPGKNAKRGEKSKRSGDDKGKRGKADRSRVAGSEQYEVSYFARRHKITAAQAREIIAEAGPDREAANRLAERRKQS